MNKRGFTLVEALIGIMIIEVGIFAALFLNQQMGRSNKSTRDSLNYALFRNQVLVFMSSPLVWKHTLTGPANTAMACWLNQDKFPIGPRNCANKSGDLVVYDIKDKVQYDFTSPTAGLTPQGVACTNFSAATGAGNGDCPMRFTLKWKAVCQAGDPECTNPLIEVDGNFTFNGAPGQDAPPMARLSFATYHYLKYCPDQASPWTLADSGTAPAVTLVPPPPGTPSQVISGNTGKVLSTSYAQLDQRITPCRNIDITFKENMDAIPNSPLLATDAENRSRVCLYDDFKNACRFEFVRDTSGGVKRFRLRDGTTDVFISPASVALTDNTIFQFQIRVDRVDFAVDGRVLYTFYQKLTYPFRLQFQPASNSYSPQGFYNIQTDVRD